MLHLLFSVRSAYLPINNPKPSPRAVPSSELPLEAFAIFNFAVLKMMVSRGAFAIFNVSMFKMMVSRGAFAILNPCIVWNDGFA